MDLASWLLIFSILGLLILLLQSVALGLVLRQPGAAGRGDLLPPVSILKPLKGMDDQLEENLRSFCRLDYQDYEIIFCFTSEMDPALDIARRIMDDHPEVKMTCVIQENTECLNPKVNSLLEGYRRSAHPVVLISDSNVRVKPDYLAEIGSTMVQSGAGLVHNLIVGVKAGSIGSIFENLHLNSFVAGSVSFLERFLRMPCVVGKSMLMEMEALEGAGGRITV